ncbi:MAG: hypothetical protein KDL87_17885 [Verrucomicrobiae bacterium]|nr:hypothetical protein [Verrucomicrobiae bacterium]
MTAAARAAMLETVRRASPAEIEEAAACLVAEGHLVPDTAFEEANELEDNKDDDRMDQELTEEDDPFLDGWDDDRRESLDGQSREGESSEGEFDERSSFRLLVDTEDGDAECSVEYPAWVRWRGATPFGRDWMANLERRLNVLGAVAGWLTDQRRYFLKSADPRDLGSDADNEVRSNYASVTQGGLIDHLRLTDMGEKSIISSALDGTQLEWPDGSSLPLDFLFSREARMAWTANAIKKLSAQAGWTMQQVLERYSKTAIPKSREKEWRTKSTEGLDLEDFIIKANALADTKWTEVVKTHKSHMLDQPR